MRLSACKADEIEIRCMHDAIWPTLAALPPACERVSTGRVQGSALRMRVQGSGMQIYTTAGINLTYTIDN